VQRGTFREDLYFRLNVISVVLPPLRERRADIPRLTDHFIAKHTSKSARGVTGCSPDALACLCNYHWPGNVRELENTIERAMVLGSTELILVEDLTDSIRESSIDSAGSGAKFHDILRDIKRKLVLKALEGSKYNYAEAARALGLHPNNLHRLIRNLNIRFRAKD
jgi:transcriptional regulator with PAS, ATPase and Fis domain